MKGKRRKFSAAFKAKVVLEAEASLSVLREVVARHGKPEIVNSDQGSQFTCRKWVGHLKVEGIRISMDGKGRALDNIYIERLWRTLKRDYFYLNPAKDGWELYQGVKSFFSFYNHKKHQGIGRRIPVELYKQQAA